MAWPKMEEVQARIMGLDLNQARAVLFGITDTIIQNNMNDNSKPLTVKNFSIEQAAYRLIEILERA